MENQPKLKGIFEQIRELPAYELGDINFAEFEKAIKKAEKDNAEHWKRVQKRIKENRIHLEKRAKELGKEIPFYLGYVMCDTKTHYVGSDFLEEYKEWL